MRAVILAAGRGSRLGSLSDDRPKCMVELANKPLIHRQIAALRRGGSSSIGVVRGYLGNRIAVDNVTFFENPRWAETNMVMSLAAAAPWLQSGSVLVSYADIFYSHEVIRDLAASPGDLVVAYDPRWKSLWTERFEDPLSDAETFQMDSQGNLTDIGRRPTCMDDVQGQYMGLLKFTPAAWSAVASLLAALDPKQCDSMDMTRLLRTLLNSGFPIATVGITGQWGEIDSSSDLELYERMILEGKLRLDN